MGSDRRLLVIVGPCSAWPAEAVFEYAKNLQKISDKTKSHLKIIMRVYTQKPRTISGWNGPLLQPNPYGPIDLEKGMQYANDLMIKILNIGLPIADEALFLAPSKILKKYLSWIAIGARSTEDQEHRNFASAVDIPVGLKNPTSGSVETGVNSVLASQSSQINILNAYKNKTIGNPFSHLVMRGSNKGSNCTEKELKLAMALLLKNKVKNPAVIIDVSHGNCVRKKTKNHNIQIDNVREILRLINKNPSLGKYFKGFMLESFIEDGAQDIKKVTPKNINKEGLSITDPCLSWEKTEKLIFEIFNNMKKKTKM